MILYNVRSNGPCRQGYLSKGCHSAPAHFNSFSFLFSSPQAGPSTHLVYLLHRPIMSTDGLDFSDGPQLPLGDDPDTKFSPDASQPAHLQRNKTERRRLQGLQRFNNAIPVTTTAYQPKSLLEKWDRWMINEGGKRLFFFSWIFLHLLVAVFGFLNYQLKDNLTTARATFGITFGAYSLA